MRSFVRMFGLSFVYVLRCSLFTDSNTRYLFKGTIKIQNFKIIIIFELSDLTLTYLSISIFPKVVNISIHMNQANVKTLAVLLFLIFGTISTFAYKLQGSVTVKQGLHEQKFFHPYMQTFVMFAGEAVCLIFFLFSSNNNTDKKQPGKLPHSPWIFVVPAAADACSSMLRYMGLNFVSGSTFMMFKGGSIVTTALFAKILIGMVLLKRHTVGCFLAVLGIVIVGSSGFLENSQTKQSTFEKQLIGYSLMSISLVFNGFFYAWEQYLLKKHTINSMQIVGYEGVFGMAITLIGSIILSYVQCPFSPSMCVYTTLDEPFIQLPKTFFSQLMQHPSLMLLSILGAVSIGVYNLNGLIITKKFDALARSLLNNTKTAIIWVVGILVTLTFGKENKEYRVQSLDLGVNFVKVIGFAAIIVGTLVYNRQMLADWFDSEKVKTDTLLEIQEEDQPITLKEKKRRTKAGKKKKTKSH